MLNRRLFISGTAAAGALALAGCRIDTVTPIRASEILSVAKTGAPVPVIAMASGLFASETWCQDEGAMAIDTLSSPGMPIQLLGCSKSGKQANGQFQVTASLVRTAGGSDAGMVVAEVLGGELARFAVFPHGKHKNLLSVGLFLDVARLEASKQQLMSMPVFKRGHDEGTFNLSFTVNILNDLPNDAKFYLGDVSAGGDAPADEAMLTIPPGGMDTITLDAATQTQLQEQGWVNFFAMAAK